MSPISSQPLPNSISSISTAAARIREIKVLYNKLDQCEHGVRGYQNLPRHMQRRAVSYNPRRLPKVMRDRHLREIGNKRKISKRPNRKYKRRPSKFVANYNQRKLNNSWLETHIWHAKHFHMMKQWGCSLPKTPTNKSYRATIRAAASSCLIQDVSYEECFELEGSVDDLVQMFTEITSKEDLLQLQELIKKSNLQTNCMELMLYHPKKCPFKAIGFCQTIFWRSSKFDNLKLWFWTHPSISEEVLLVLDSLLSLASSSEPTNVTRCSQTFSTITVTPIKNSLAKFRLTGPESKQLLSQVFLPSEVTFSLANDQSSFSDKEWWKSFYSDPLLVENNKRTNDYWNSRQIIRQKCVFGLTVRDPRFVLPKKKVPITIQDKKNEEETLKLQNNGCEWPIFSSAIREKVNSSMRSTHEINELRSKILIPGTPYPLQDDESRIPIIVLNRLPSHPNQDVSGFDVIMPSKWSRPSWIALTLNGGVAGGQDEEKTLLTQFINKLPPYLLPDTQAGTAYAAQLGDQRRSEYLRRPPNCRLNYLKLGVPEPFDVNWLNLVRTWNDDCENYFVLRDSRKINVLSRLTCKAMRSTSEGSLDSIKLEEDTNLSSSLGNYLTEEGSQFLDQLAVNNCLIYVRIVNEGKGAIENLAMIYLPTKEDLNSMSQQKDNSCSLIERVHKDLNEQKRKLLKATHKTQINRLRKKKRKAKDRVLNRDEDPLLSKGSMMEAVEAAKNEVLEKEKDTVKETNLYRHKMNDLWLPREESIQICERPIMGYVMDGRFNQRMGRSAGIGWVVGKPLLQLIQTVNDGTEAIKKPNQVHVLVRNPSSLNYRWARLVVLKV